MAHHRRTIALPGVPGRRMAMVGVGLMLWRCGRQVEPACRPGLRGLLELCRMVFAADDLRRPVDYRPARVDQRSWNDDEGLRGTRQHGGSWDRRCGRRP